MNQNTKIAMLLFTAVLILSFVQMSTATPSKQSGQDDVVNFLKSVVQIDTAHYVVQPVSYIAYYPAHLGGLAYGVGTLNLTSANSELSATYIMINQTLVNCGLTSIRESPVYLYEPTGLLNSAKGVLERYQNLTKTTYTQAMPNMLNKVDVTKNSTTIVDNIKLSVQNENNFTYLSWMYSSNGIDFPAKGVSITFKDGLFYDFGDSYNLYKVGSDKVQVLEQEATDAALALAKDYELVVGTGNVTTQVQFSIDTDHIDTMLTTVPREPLTLYPAWEIRLHLDKAYYSVYGFQARLWADTQEVIFFNPLSMGGATEKNTHPSPTTIPANNDPKSTPPNNTYLLGLAATTILVAAITIIVIINKRKRQIL